MNDKRLEKKLGNIELELSLFIDDLEDIEDVEAREIRKALETALELIADKLYPYPIG